MLEFEFDAERISPDAAEAALGIFAVALSNGVVAVLFSDGQARVVHISDYSEQSGDQELPVARGDLDNWISDSSNYLSTRSSIAAHLNRANVSSGVVLLRTAAPLCGTIRLNNDLIMYRYTAGHADICYSSSTSVLREGIYLVPPRDDIYLNSGFGAVGRYSLPCPYPASYRHEYIILKGTSLSVGTVEPQFRQSGGGGEARLDHASQVHVVRITQIDDF